METEFIEESVRTRLILSGINELFERGIKDFSLRRVALSAEVSCAAPYRHFKDKEELIAEIIKFIVSKWELLCREIDTVFKNDIRRRIIELSVSSLRFWIANPNYRSILMTVSPSGIKALSLFDNSLVSAIREWCVEREQDFESKKYTVLALIYGSLMLLDENYDGLFLADKLRGKLEEEFQN